MSRTAIHFTLLVLENPKTADLGREKFGILFTIIDADAEKNT